MSLTTCPYCRRLNFAKAETCATCERVFRPGELQAKADAEDGAHKRKYNGLPAALFMLVPAAQAFVVLRGT